MYKLDLNTRSKRTLMLIVSALVLPSVVLGRIADHLWTFEEMFEKADLVVIGSMVSTKDTDERETILDDIKVIGVITQFTPLLVLKGPKSASSIQLRHYRLQNQADAELANGPELVQVGPTKSTFLLFLTREKTGNYAPVTGQIDPALYSVVPLHSAAN